MNPGLEPILPVERLLYCSDAVKIGRFDCPPDHPCFPRTAPLHNNLLVFTRKPLWWGRGDGRYRFVEPGAALLHHAGGEVERKNEGPAGDCADWFGFRGEVFDAALERHGLQGLKVTERTVALLTEPGFRLLENQLISKLHHPPMEPLAVEETALSLLDRVCAGLSKQPLFSRKSSTARLRRQRLADRARAMLDHIENDRGPIDRNLRLSDIARSLGTSAYHLCRVFRSECGLTMHAYRQRQRLGRAITLMQAARQDLTSLAFELGYSSHSHFSRVFRQYVGSSPSVFNIA